MSTNAETLERLKKIEAERQELLKKMDQDREAYKQLVADRVPLVVAKLIKIEAQLIEAKAEVFQSFKDIIELKAAVFGVKDNQQSHTFRSGNNVIKIGFRVNDGWDDTATAGIAKVNNFISSLTSDNDPDKKKLVSGILKLLKQDKKGNLNPSRILDLQQMAKEYNDPEFTDGVNIIMNAHQPTRSVWFIEAEQPDEVRGTRPIDLSISAVGFPEGFNFDFVNENTEQDA